MNIDIVLQYKRHNSNYGKYDTGCVYVWCDVSGIIKPLYFDLACSKGKVKSTDVKNSLVEVDYTD